LTTLPKDEQLRVELELAKVNDVSGRESQALLLEAAAGNALPSGRIPEGASLALWFLLHHPGLFHEVFFLQEIRDVQGWHTARGPAGVTLDPLRGRGLSLAAGLAEFFQVREGTGQFCAVSAHRLNKADCFVGHVADRLRLFDIFTDSGEHTTARLRP